MRTPAGFKAGSTHAHGLSVDINDMDWGGFVNALASAYRDVGHQIRLFAHHMRPFANMLENLYLFPEFAALDKVRWAWPTYRVRYRPFDYKVDAGPQRGPDDRRIGEVRWFA